MVLVEGLEARGATLLELDAVGLAVAAALASREVVVDFVVIPNDRVGSSAVQLLQARIAPVEAVLTAVLGKRDGFELPADRTEDLAIRSDVSVLRLRVVVAVLVDVVAQSEPVVRLLGGKIVVQLVVAGLPVGARRLAEDERLD